MMVVKDNLCVALLPYDLMFQMGKILAIDTAEEQAGTTSYTVNVILHLNKIIRTFLKEKEVALLTWE